MSQTDKTKWDQRYCDGAYSQRTHASALLSEWLPRLYVESRSRESQKRHAVDIGCGAGRNALHLARSGLEVTALDISQVALDRLAAAAAQERLPVACIQADLEAPDAVPSALRAQRRYDLALMMRYTNLPLIDDLKSALKPGAYLMVELHLQSNADVIGPHNPNFRVAAGELLRAADGLDVVEYREGLVDEPDGRIAALAQLIARA